MIATIEIRALDLHHRLQSLRSVIKDAVGVDQLEAWEAEAAEVKEKPLHPPALDSTLVEVDDLSDLKRDDGDEEGAAEDIEELVAERTHLTWLVRFTVNGTWVADGFNLTDERAMEMLRKDLRKDLDYAHEYELGAKVLAAPPLKTVRELQGARKEELAELEAAAAQEQRVYWLTEEREAAKEIVELLSDDALSVFRLRRAFAGHEALDMPTVVKLIDKIRTIAGLPSALEDDTEEI